jgi:hypothetical protein
MGGKQPVVTYINNLRKEVNMLRSEALCYKNKIIQLSRANRQLRLKKCWMLALLKRLGIIK